LLVGAVAGSLLLTAGAALAQGVFRPLETVVVNPPTMPVPVTGTVKLDGGVGAISGAVKSADKNVVLVEQTLTVTSTTGGNAVSAVVDVSDYKEVRIAISSGSCGPCSPVVGSVYAYGTGVSPFQIDELAVNGKGEGVAEWVTRTYTVPGQRFYVSLRSTVPGGNNSVRVLVVGRAN
jgi:hypothetical protein